MAHRSSEGLKDNYLAQDGKSDQTAAVRFLSPLTTGSSCALLVNCRICEDVEVCLVFSILNAALYLGISP